MLERDWYQDRSHEKVHIVATHGLAASLDETIERFRADGLDVSPKLDHGLWFLLVVNQYEPEPVTLQITQDHAEKDAGWYTAIVCTGIGPRVDEVALQAATCAKLSPQPLSEEFLKVVRADQEPLREIYDQFASLDPSQASKHFATTLRMQQQRYHRGTWKKGLN